MDFPADYKGKLVLLDFWATWCGPCRAELPHVVKTQERFAAQGLEILGITLDGLQQIPAASVQRFVKDQRMTWEQIHADGPRIAAAYNVSAIPEAMLVDGDTGQILATGDALRGQALTATVEKYMKQRTR